MWHPNTKKKWNWFIMELSCSTTTNSWKCVTFNGKFPLLHYTYIFTIALFSNTEFRDEVFFFMWTLPFWLFLFQLHQFKCFRNYFNNDISVICSKQLKPLEVRTLNINSNKKCNQYMKVGPHLYFMEHKPKSFHRKKYIHTKEKNKVT